MYLSNDVIEKACKMVNKTSEELENLKTYNSDSNNCKKEIYLCIINKCPALNMCYDNLEILE